MFRISSDLRVMNVVQKSCTIHSGLIFTKNKRVIPFFISFFLFFFNSGSFPIFSFTSDFVKLVLLFSPSVLSPYALPFGYPESFDAS